MPSPHRDSGIVLPKSAPGNANCAFVTPDWAHDLNYEDLSTLVQVNCFSEETTLSELSLGETELTVLSAYGCAKLASVIPIAKTIISYNGEDQALSSDSGVFDGDWRVSSIKASMQSLASDESNMDETSFSQRVYGLCLWIVDIDDPTSLAPMGRVGELWVEGPLLGQGGVDKDQSFVENPPWLVNGTENHPGRNGLLLRTGSLAKYRQDGTIQLLGQDLGGETCVVSADLSASELNPRRSISRGNDEVSELYIQLDEASQDDIESTMQNIWAAILRVDPAMISKDSHFFRMGGDMVQAMLLCNAAGSSGMYINTRDIYKHSYLKNISEVYRRHRSKNRGEPRPALLSAVESRQARSQVSRLCNIEESRVLDILPCTPLQEGLLALTVKHPGDYVARNVFKIGKNVELVKLKTAWDYVVMMNTILRTRIVSLPDNGLVQAVLAEETHWVDSLAEEDSVMSLGAPLTRFSLLPENAEGDVFLLWEIHHALYDGWSMNLLLQDVQDVYYGNELQDLESIDAFLDYVTAMDKHSRDEFWRSQFAGIQGCHFPTPKNTDNPRPDQKLEVSVSDLDWFNSDFTSSTILRAAWCIVSAHNTNSDEALFGVTVTGRQAPVSGIERITGPTIATVPLRIVLDWDKDVESILHRVQQQSVDMIPFEQTGLQHIRRLGEEPSLACNFQTLLVVQPPSSGGSVEPEEEFLTEVHDGENANKWQDFSTYALVIECQLEAEGVHVRLGFDSTIVSETKMAHVAANLETVIRQLSDQRLRRQTLRSIFGETLTTFGLDQIWAWNRVVPEPTELCVHDLITQRTLEDSSAPAICAWDGHLTYGQLAELSENLAQRLASLNVRGFLIPLYFEKSMWMPVAAVAVMKAGAGVVAVDMKLPEERIRSLISQLGSPVALSSVENQDLVRKIAGSGDVLIVGPGQQCLEPLHLPTKLPLVQPSDTVYTVFTSGSTGTPKGAMVSHGNFCSAITHQQRRLMFSRSSRVLDFSSYAFDASWCNLIHALTSGGCLCIPSAYERENQLAECFKKYNVTTVDLTPSVARMLGPKVLSDLSTLILGGEAVVPADAFLAGDKTAIINVYGPAECTPTVTLSEVSADGITIGRGAGVCTWVVDVNNSQFLAPLGEIGELWVEGPLVGQGYLANPDKTATVFVKDPAWLSRGAPGHPGRTGRVYRTGDLVRYTSSGELIFVGRKDTQVKIRGQRVELEDLEHHIASSMDSVKSNDIKTLAVVAETIRPKQASSAILVAFVALESSEAELTDERHRMLVQSLVQEGSEPFDLSPIQQLFFDAYPTGLNHFNQTFVLELGSLVPGARFFAAVKDLVDRHAILRNRFHRPAAGAAWKQSIAPKGPSSFAFVEHHVSNRDEVMLLSQWRQEHLDIENGPVFACDLFNIAGDVQLVTLSAHHLVVDLVSWRIIWGDIEDHIRHGNLISAPSTSWKSWLRRQIRANRHASPISVLPYSVPLPDLEFWGLPLGENTFGNCTLITEEFESSVTNAIFGDANECLRTEPVDILLGAMAHSFHRIFPERCLPTIWLEGHGREYSQNLPVDVSGTVGWFTTLHPVPIPVKPGDSVIEAIRFAKDIRRKVPGKGQPYFACRFYSESGREAAQGQDITEVTFNFTGRFQQLEAEEGLFKRPEHLGDSDYDMVDVSPTAHRLTMIEITADVEDDWLMVSFQVHQNMRHQERLQRWAQEFGTSVRSAVTELSKSRASFTLSDLPLLPMSYGALDALLCHQLPSLGIQADNVVDILPCSPLQQGILLSSEKESASYATCSTWRCLATEGMATTIEPERLRAAWTGLVQRHPILSTVFALHPEGDGFIQIILKNANVQAKLVKSGSQDPDAMLNTLQRPHFEAHEPQHVFFVCQSDNGDVACRLDISHALMDAASMSVILQELINLYDGIVPAPVPPFRRVMNHICSISRAQRISPWVSMLSGVAPCEFPLAIHTASAGDERHGDIPVPPLELAEVSRLCMNLGITRAVFFQVAWAMVLATFTGMDEVCFGYLASGRDAPINGIEGIVGPLANLLISRIDLRDSPRNVLESVSARSIQHLAMQYASLAEIQHELGISGKKLFNTSLSIRESDKLKSYEKRSLSFEASAGEDPHEIVGTDEVTTTAFWREQFQGTTSSHFPSPPAVQRSRTYNEVSLFQKGGPHLDSDIESRTYIKAAWAIVAARTLDSTEAIFGLASDDHSLLPVRIPITWTGNVNNLLQSIQKQGQDMEIFKRTGLQRIRRISAEASLACDFQSVLSVNNDDAQQVQSGDYAIFLKYIKTQLGSCVSIKFDSSTLSEDEVTRLFYQFEHVHQQLLSPAARELRVQDVSMTSSRDLQDIWTWNAKLPEAVSDNMPRMIRETVHRQPCATAIHAWDGSLSYQQLDDLSTTLAYHLRKVGVEKGDMIPLCFEKSMWMPVSALAIMKTGAACVATDPSNQPEERLRGMTAQIEAKTILASVAYTDMAKRLGADNVISVDLERLFEFALSLDHEPSLPEINASDILYIIFTSGTTGVPKGAMVTHGNYCSAIVHQRELLGFESNSRVLDFSSYAFDVVWSNMLNTLTAGGCLCIPSAEERQDSISGCLEKYQATVADFTPSVLRNIEPKTALTLLSTMLLGGEVVLPSDAQYVREGARVVSAYGPAECTPTSLILPLTCHSDGGLGLASGLCTWVVDADHADRLAPIGTIGELWLEGALVGAGYVNNPAKTKAAYVQDPEWLLRGVPGKRPGRRGRAYRTGDLVQYREDGSLVFKGRKDTQVKIRGQRVELEEVEHYVQDAVSAAAQGNMVTVVAETIRPKGSHGIMLVAFVCLGSRDEVSDEDYEQAIRGATRGIAGELGERLPPFMIPSVFIPVRNIPMTPTGKTDRRHLRSYGSSLTLTDIAALSRTEGERRAPTTDSEQLMQGLWAEVLNMEPGNISIDDSFFRIGGDSIGAMKLVGLARKTGLPLAVKDVFKYPVMRDLCTLLY
ncbi:Nonribosomal peptide synthetase dtxS1 [Metarhizium anisopliae]